MKRISIHILAAAAWSLFNAGDSYSQTIRVDENVPFSVTIVQPATAGDDIINQYTNTLGDYDVNVQGGTYNRRWHVDISKTVTAGDPDLELDVLRDPNDNGVRNGPTTFTAVPTDPSNMRLFSSNNQRNARNPGVEIQYQLVASITTANMRQGNFVITVIFTLSSGLN